jgi:thiamine pyrophosphokinase
MGFWPIFQPNRKQVTMSKVLIVCNGESPPTAMLQAHYRRADWCIAADGGYDILMAAGLCPQVVTGDLDSLMTHVEEGVRVVMNPDQETNDLEKALQLAYDEGARHIVVLGATGLKLDQTLKNLSVLLQFHPRFESIYFDDERSRIMILEKKTEISLEIGTYISLYPLSGKVDGIVTEGLKYPLMNESLQNGLRDGSSNEVISDPVRIQYTSGSLLAIIHH